MTRQDYDDLERRAARPFHTRDGLIIVPELHVMSMIVATCDLIGSRARPCAPELAPHPDHRLPLAHRQERPRRHLGTVRRRVLRNRRETLQPAHPVRAPVVEQIYSWRTDGKLSVRAITARLNADPAAYPPTANPAGPRPT